MDRLHHRALWIILILNWIHFHAAVLVSNISAEWSGWGDFGDCSRPCGGGLANKTRTCLGATHTCVGSGIRYKTCNTQDCAGGVGSLREIQCQSYNNVSIKDNYFHWVPHYNHREPCVLYCKTIPAETEFVLKMEPRVMNGTSCGKKNGGVCVSGRCKKVACDGTVGSKRSLDSCGVCGGDGSSCDVTRGFIRRHATRKDERYHWHVRWSACSKSCGDGLQEAVVLCKDKTTQEAVPTHQCNDANRPADPEARRCQVKLCQYRWHTFAWGSCSRTCGQGFKYRRVTCLKHDAQGQQTEMSEDHCVGVKPSVRTPCTLEDCPDYLTGPWSQCSVTCGYGEQKRKVVCSSKSADSCRSAYKPEAVQKCFAGKMCEDPRSFQRDDSSMPVHDFYDNARLQEMFTFPKFHTTNWGPCTVTCGIGYQHRNITCQKGGHVVPITDCEGIEPHSKRECHNKRCTTFVQHIGTFAWHQGKFRACSQTCGKGTQESMVECIDTRSNFTVLDGFCNAATKPNPTVRYCNTVDCGPSFQWKVSEYGECSVPCGGGRQSRDVECIRVTSRGSTETAERYRCPDPIPLSERSCNLQFCQAEWSTGSWGECSVTCGLGYEMRSVYCVKLIKSGLQVNVSITECLGPRPSTTRQCHFGECYVLQQLPRIKEQKGTFIQIQRTKKIRLIVGETALLLRNQAVKINCPVKNFQKKLIFWSKDHRIIPLVGRVRVTSNGALKITRANPREDAGVYTCSANMLHASVKVSFHSKRQAKVKQAEILDTIFVGNFSDSSRDTVANGNDKAINRPQSDTGFYPTKDTKFHRVNSISNTNQHAYSAFSATGWSDCSETCGWGTQTRQVTCNHVTDNFIRLLPKEECLKKRSVAPPESRKCIVEEECARWVSSDWSECSVDNCHKEGYSTQTRTVTCQYKNGTRASRDKCKYGNAGNQPALEQHCKNLDCVAVWTTSKWSECSPACGDNGKKYRTLKCEWVVTNAPAMFSCREKARPSVSKSCKLPPCSQVACKDHSSSCERIGRLKMCRYTIFRRKCCKSCRYANMSWNSWS